MKSILVIDTPKSCEKCKTKCDLYWDYILIHAYKSTITKRHPQCPLQDTTELLEAVLDIGCMTTYRIVDIDDTEEVEISSTNQWNKLNKALGGE